MKSMNNNPNENSNDVPEVITDNTNNVIAENEKTVSTEVQNIDASSGGDGGGAVAVKSRSKKIFNIVFAVFSSLLFLISISTLVFTLINNAQGKTPKIFGYSMYIVLTESMTPLINVDDLIFVKEADVDTVIEKYEKYQETEENPVDIVFLAPSGEVRGYPVVHRVVEVLEDANGEFAGFKTKGVANPSVDDWTITKGNLLGVVTGQSTFLGKFFSFFTKNPQFVYMFLFIVIGAVIITEAINIVVNAQKLKKEKAMEASIDKDELKQRAMEEVLKMYGNQAQNEGQNSDNLDSSKPPDNSAEKEETTPQEQPKDL